jgi:Fic family protein
MTLSYFQVDTHNERLNVIASKHNSAWHDFNYRLDLSWIYHDHGLEGIVLQPHEISAAINDKISSDNNSFTIYQEIKNLYKSIQVLRENIHTNGSPQRVKGLLHTCYQQLVENVRGISSGNGLRQEDSRYGAYYHKCCPHGEVDARLRKLLTTYNQIDLEDSHPIVQAAYFHYEFMQIMPFGRFSGKLARLFSNLLLMRYNYPAVIIHSVERARYYEALAQEEPTELLNLFSESLTSTIDSGLQFFQSDNLEQLRHREPRRSRSRRDTATSTSKRSSRKRKTQAVSTDKTSTRKREAAKKNTSRPSKSSSTASSTNKTSRKTHRE